MTNGGFGKRHMVSPAVKEVAAPAATAIEDEEETPDGAALRKRVALLALGSAGAILGAVLLLWGVDFTPPPVLGKDGKPVALIPDNELLTPKDDLARSLALVERYPHDPRGHLFRGIYFLERRDLAASERELRAALDEPEILKRNMPRSIEPVVRMTLAIVLANRGRKPEAVTIASSVCGKNVSGVDDEFRQMFASTGVCEGQRPAARRG